MGFTIETLESRQFMSATATLVNGVLKIVGTDGDDKIVVKNHAPVALFLDVTLNGVAQQFALDNVNSIQVNGGLGNDVLDLRATNLSSKIYGEAGNDTIYGTSNKDRIMGGAGNDWINAGAGNDVIYGEAGRDRLFGDAGKDYIYAGRHKDVVRGGAGKDYIIATVGVDDLRSNPGDVITHIQQ